jgi:small GTP-binding protein
MSDLCSQNLIWKDILTSFSQSLTLLKEKIPKPQVSGDEVPEEDPNENIVKIKDLFVEWEKLFILLFDKPLLMALLIENYFPKLQTNCSVLNSLVKDSPVEDWKTLDFVIEKPNARFDALKRELSDLTRAGDVPCDKVMRLLTEFGYKHPETELDDFFKDVEALEAIIATNTTADQIDPQDAVGLQEIIKEPPSFFYCPLTNKVMEEPLIVLSTGISYERRALAEYMVSHDGNDPEHSDIYSSCDENPMKTIALPNQRLKLQIEKWKTTKKSTRQQPSKRSTSSRTKSTEAVISEFNFFRDTFYKPLIRAQLQCGIKESDINIEEIQNEAWKKLLERVCLVFFLSSNAWQMMLSACNSPTIEWKLFKNYFPNSGDSIILAERTFTRFILCFPIDSFPIKSPNFLSCSNLLENDDILMDTPYVPLPGPHSWNSNTERSMSTALTMPIAYHPPSCISPEEATAATIAAASVSQPGPTFIPFLELQEYLTKQYLLQLQTLGNELSCELMKISGKSCLATFFWDLPIQNFPNTQVSANIYGENWNALIAQREEILRRETTLPQPPPIEIRRSSTGLSQSRISRLSRLSSAFVPEDEFAVSCPSPVTALPFLFSPNDQIVLGKIFPCFSLNCLLEKMCSTEYFHCKLSFFRLQDHYPVIERNILNKWNGKQFIAYAEYFFPEMLEYLDSSLYAAKPEVIAPTFIQDNPDYLRKTFIRTKTSNFLYTSNERSQFYPPVSDDLVEKMFQEIIPTDVICMRIIERIIPEYPRPSNLWKARYEAENLEKSHYQLRLSQQQQQQRKSTDSRPSDNQNSTNRSRKTEITFVEASTRLVVAASRIPPAILAEMKPSPTLYGRSYSLSFAANPSVSHQRFLSLSTGSRPNSATLKKSVAREAMKYDVIVKHLLVGESGVGKTKLLNRLALDEYEEELSEPTKGLEFKSVRDFLYGKRVKQDISDTGGNSRYRNVILPYIMSTMSVFLVYDITNRKSFEVLQQYWIPEVRSRIKTSTVLILIGNKSDCSKSERVVSYEEGEELSKELGCPFYETSAKDDIHVSLAFHMATNLLLLKIYHPDKENVEEAMKLLSGGDEVVEEEIRQSVVVLREMARAKRKKWFCLLL